MSVGYILDIDSNSKNRKISLYLKKNKYVRNGKSFSKVCINKNLEIINNNAVPSSDGL